MLEPFGAPRSGGRRLSSSARTRRRDARDRLAVSRVARSSSSDSRCGEISREGARGRRRRDRAARCGVATDHWNRWAEDFRLLAGLGAKAYRLSIEWSRIEPRPGEYDDTALARYVEMISALRDLGIEPFVTLLHFTHPVWFHEK